MSSVQSSIHVDLFLRSETPRWSVSGVEGDAATVTVTDWPTTVAIYSSNPSQLRALASALIDAAFEMDMRRARVMQDFKRRAVS